MQFLKEFYFNGKPLRVMMDNEDLWFVAQDVCACLGYCDTSPLRNLCEGDKAYEIIDNRGARQKMLVIDETGLDHLLTTSQMPDAVRFKQWVNQKVYPQIYALINDPDLDEVSPVQDAFSKFKTWVIEQPEMASRLRSLVKTFGLLMEGGQKLGKQERVEAAMYANQVIEACTGLDLLGLLQLDPVFVFEPFYSWDDIDQSIQ